ncbi:phospholipase [Jeotgalibacillus sp. S-D1]|uniref:phospholipase D family protein n=1 Tax=Jeotgalibacillus sp. S-D1 TaxID=2552189 RepID=UPI00105A8E31|nr:phospholipase D family protein [Jeotgalibacillus sp. S-D1]TDL34941.1 phospholipase [Jeotgalibacillus sp. S-D1]
MLIKNKPWKKKRWYILLFLIIFFSILIYHQYKPIPDGVSYESKEYEVSDVKFFRDLTYLQGEKQVHDQEIFSRVEEMITEAEEFIIIDMFLMDGRVNEDKGYPDLSGNLMKQLIDKKANHPDMPIVFITDPVNTGYYSYEGDWLKPMEKAGIDVVMTDLDPLRDSTPLFSTAWRMGLQWFGQSGQTWVRNAFVDDGPKMTVRSYLMMANVKANHRKAFITDQSALISSGNAHNESGFHSNVAFEVGGPIIQDMINTEQAVIDFSNSNVKLPDYSGSEISEGELTARYTTEGKTWEQIIAAIQFADKGDEIWMAMFYLSEREVINALQEAATRGVNIQLILDPNETAFGNKKTGLPNRPVVNELLEDTDNQVKVRWYNVVEEQFHPKMMLVKTDETSTIISGSTNFTKRNLVNYNLENNLVVQGPGDSAIMTEVDHYFKDLWNNDGGEYTVDVSKYQDTLTFWQRGVYGLQKLLGLTTY